MNLVALIESPFQLLSAFEYASLHRVERLSIIHLTSSSARSIEHVRRMFDYLRGVTNISCDIREIRRSVPLLTWLFSSERKTLFASCDRLAIGDYRSVYIRIIESRVAAETVVLDDGIATIGVIDAIVARKVVTTTNAWHLKLLAVLISQKCAKRMSVFSCIPLETFRRVAALPGDRYQYNAFQLLSANLAGRSTDHYDLAIIGGPYVETGMLSLAVYTSALQHAVATLGAKRLIYCAHRRESEQTIQHLEATLGVQVHRPELSIEFSLAQRVFSASDFVTVNSAAIFTISKLCGNFKFHFIDITERHFNAEFHHGNERVKLLLESCISRITYD